MHWNLLFGLFVVTAAANTMNDQRSNDEKVSSKELEKEWKTFKMKYGKHVRSIDPGIKAYFFKCNALFSRVMSSRSRTRAVVIKSRWTVTENFQNDLFFFFSNLLHILTFRKMYRFLPCFQNVLCFPKN